MARVRTSLLALLSSGALIVACSSGGDDAEPGTSPPTATRATTTSTTATTAPTTSSTPTPTTSTSTSTSTTVTTAVADQRADAEPGPYPVGVTTLTLPKGAPVEVWYPTATPATDTVGYDVRDYVPPAVKAVLTADIPAGYTYAAERDGAIAEGTFPLVVFSHGYSGIRVQSTFLTSHLASYGMIVAAPEHVSRDLFNILSQTASDDGADAVDDVVQTLDLLTAPTGPFAGHVDGDHVGLVGHSAGGLTVISAALDDRVDGYVSMASAGPVGGQPYPATPSLFLAGAIDGVVPAAAATRPTYAGAPSPSWYVELDATGHNGFDDFCTFGNGGGIIGLAEASGLGPVLDAQPQLRTLGQDGCVPPAAPVEQAFPVIRHATTSFLRTIFGQEAQPALDSDLGGGGAVTVTIDAH